MAVSRLFGARIKRRDDPQLITGRATFTDDVTLPGTLYAAVVRSPHAHARITRVDVTRARRHPGVHAVFTGRDLADRLAPMPCAWLVPGCELKVPRRPMLADDRVRHVGEGVAVVVADSRYAARAGAPQLHDDVPDNTAFTWTTTGGDARAAFAAADIVLRQRFVNQRLIPNAMEARAATAHGNPATGDHGVAHLAESPHPPVRALGRAQDARAQDPRDRAGGRRRVRVQDPGLSRGRARRVPGARARPAGQVGRGSPRDHAGGRLPRAGRPEATYLVERAVDLVAAKTGLDPAEVRRRNFIPKEKFPYTVPAGISYDSGDYDAALARALAMIDYDAFRREQAAARKAGRYLGLGLSTYVEICGLGPSPVAGAVGFQGGLYGSATVRMDALAPLGITHLDMPFTPRRVWYAIQERREVRA